jgi:hypothetical protein
VRKKEKPHATTRPSLIFSMRLAAGLGGLGGVGVGLWAIGPAASYFLGLLLLVGSVGLAGTAIFSTREEPNQRLVDLIKAIRGKRD